MRQAGKLIAGLLDAGSAAFGTFLAGIVAVRELDTVTLALYSLLFSATVFAMLLPRQLHYIPSQIGANLEPDLRTPRILGDVRRSWPMNAATFAIVVACGMALAGSAPWQTCLAMGLTAAGYAAISPLQDHVRASLHLVGRHLSAAWTSITLAIVTGGGTVIALTHPGAAGTDLIPFGSLLAGNAVSLVVGLVLLRGADRHTAYVPSSLSVRSQFLFSEIAIQGAALACSYVILLTLGPIALGHLEAARVTASPIAILSTAVLTFMGPAMLRRLTPSPEHPHGPRREILATVGVLAIGGLGYVLLIAFFGGVFSTILNKPIDLGLSTARITGAVIDGVSSIAGFLVFAMGRTRLALGTSVLAGATGVVGTLGLVPLIGMYALPVGVAAGSVARLVVSLRVVLRRSAETIETNPVPADA